MKNPYSNRPYPVGQLEYQLESGQDTVDALKHLAMLEFGEPELLYDIPRLMAESTGKGTFTAANLGHASGGSAILLAKGIQDSLSLGCVISVDTFKGARNSTAKFQEAYETLVKNDVQEIVTLLRGTTTFHSRHSRDFDFLFVDADHSYEGVLSDFKNWSPFVVVGGWMGYHDSNQLFCHKVFSDIRW